MRISDWSSDVCSSDLHALVNNAGIHRQGPSEAFDLGTFEAVLRTNALGAFAGCQAAYPHLLAAGGGVIVNIGRSEEHTSELQSLMRTSYDVFCLQKKNEIIPKRTRIHLSELNKYNKNY